MVRYVEGNALRPGLVKRAEEWPGSSVPARRYGDEKQKNILSPWPVAEPWRLSRLTPAQGRTRTDPRCRKQKPAVRVGGIGQGKGCAIRLGKYDEEPWTPEPDTVLLRI